MCIAATDQLIGINICILWPLQSGTTHHSASYGDKVIDVTSGHYWPHPVDNTSAYGGAVRFPHRISIITYARFGTSRVNPKFQH